MLSFINDFQATIAGDLSDSDIELPLSPADISRLDFSGGQEYLLTLADSLDPSARTMTEIVRVSAGLAIERGQEGTTPHSWPAGTPVMCSITAGGLAEIASPSSGPAPPVVADTPPDRPPLLPGELWVTPQRAYIAQTAGTVHGWRRISGWPLSPSYWTYNNNQMDILVGPHDESIHIAHQLSIVDMTAVIETGISAASAPPEGAIDKEFSIRVDFHEAPENEVRLVFPAPTGAHTYTSFSVDQRIVDAAQYDADSGSLTLTLTSPATLRVDVNAEADTLFGEFFWSLKVENMPHEAAVLFEDV